MTTTHETHSGPALSDTPGALGASSRNQALRQGDQRLLSAAEEPILPGFYPDPTICRVGADYYLANSSFEYFPGVPLFHSTDLVSWTQLGHILTRRSQFRRGDDRPSTGIYAGTLRHRDGRFWYVTTNVSDFAAGQLIVSAVDPSGPWSEPTFVPDAVGIDPDLCWDEDGTCFITWKAMDFVVETGILQAPIDLATGELLAAPYPIWQGSGLDAAEGPHLYRIADRWYLVLAEGGTERGHSVTVARGPHPWGPFEACPANPIFSHRSTVTHPVQNVGHADLVQTEHGDWAAVYLGARARGSTPGFHVLGRETFLAGISWVDGWPVFEESRFDVPRMDLSWTDDFSSDQLDFRWVVPGGEPSSFVFRRGASGLALQTAPSALLCTRVRDLGWRAEAVVEGAGSFSLRLDDRHWYGLELDEGRVTARAQMGDVRHTLASAEMTADSVTLVIESVPPATPSVPLGQAGPDDIVLSVRLGAETRELGRLDGRYLSTEVASGFTGRMLAIGATMQSPARVCSVVYRPQ
ncbi:glycoside hydrolase family 43 protein [Herbiconiux sp. SYSU D00978]|uniref:glycoside hydrolase family 43 protein n=1 Tax=Herbiconiux sp. SYSU D00978 TaxID=2812562 RepID=UPI0027DE1341|nr:family 43 glycosylhydrolase [Herbiconiux sp. SYSU D00978]